MGSNFTGITIQKPKAIIGCVMILGVLLRIWGLYWGLPFGYNPDENRILLITINFFTGDFNPHHFIYPTFFMYILFGVFSVIWETCSFFFNLPDPIFGFFMDPSFFYLTGRLVSVAFGAATVYLLYRLGCEAFSQKLGLLAAFFLCVNFLHIKHREYH